MATTTTNFGWDIPQSTDLVKDGATAIAALGQDIDTALIDLKGGTTGQVLAKASNTDLDYSWVAQDDSNAIQNAIVDAKGDLIGATAADTPARLAVGTNGQVLTADSTAATGLAWTTVSSSPTFVGTHLTKSVDQSINSNSLTQITWDTETFDTDSFHSTSTNTSRITIPSGKAGYYRLTTRITFAGVTTFKSRQVRLYKNGSGFELFNQVSSGTASDGDDNSYELNTIVNLAVADYLEIYVYHLNSGSLAVRGNAQFGMPQSIFTVNYLGA
jgi:hypothetical protein